MTRTKPPRKRSGPQRTPYPMALAAAWLLLAAALAQLWGGLWLPLALLYWIASALTLVAYAWDKRAARLGRRRIAEQSLHTLALIGGWPGALLGRAWLRHKTLKQPFTRLLWLTVVANMAFLAVVVYEQGALERAYG